MNHSTMASRRNSRVHREGAEERWHIHYASHGDPADLPMDQRRWTTRLAHGDRRVPTVDKMLEDDDEVSASEFHRLIAKKFSVQISAPPIHFTPHPTPP